MKVQNGSGNPVGKSRWMIYLMGREKDIVLVPGDIFTEIEIPELKRKMKDLLILNILWRKSHGPSYCWRWMLD